MDDGNKSNGPVNYFQQEKEPGKLKKEEAGIKEDNSKITEVDDKLIGDDLEIEEAQRGDRDKVIEIKNEKDNY